jgi:uncharacterized GH25 family protein
VRTAQCVAGALLVGLTCALALLPGPDSPGAPAEEHDFWLAPSSYRPATGSTVDIALLVGHPSRHAPYVRNPRHIRRFVAAFGDTLHIVRGTPGRSPAGSVTFRSPGLAVIGYSSRMTATTLEASRFEAYLRDEGLDDVVAERERRGETQTPGRERFARSAKTILQVGGTGRVGFERRLGFPFELVPERNPYDLAPGDSLPVRLYLRGRPLGGALVTAYRMNSARATSSTRSDASGRAWLSLDGPGEWMIKSVHMSALSGDPRADWESIWATLTFELQARTDSAMR